MVALVISIIALVISIVIGILNMLNARKYIKFCKDRLAKLQEIRNGRQGD